MAKLATIGYLGGKGKRLPRLLSLLPPHDKYIEVFGGGAVLLLNKPPVSVEVYNDIDHALYEFFLTLSDPELFERFYRRVAVLPCSRELYNMCRATWDKQETMEERVWRWFVVARQSFGGYFGHSWAFNVNHSARNMAGACRAWLSSIERLPEVHARLQRVQIECSDFRRCLQTYDGDGWLAYCDPPYIKETRREGRYRYEMTLDDHKDLVNLLLRYRGSVMLSCYDHEIYVPLREAGWRRVEFHVPCLVAAKTRATGLQGKGKLLAMQMRKEVVYIKDASG